MTDKEKLLLILNNIQGDSIETILHCFINQYEDDISATRIHELICMLNNSLSRKIEELSQARRIAHVRATCLKSYLDGSMWKTEEAARRNIQPQIDNVQVIINACKSEI